MARLKMAALVLVALAACINPAQAISSVWTSSGKTLVLSTADWTLFAPIRDAKGDGKGVFVNGTKIYTFPASKNKNKPAVKSDGTTKAATLNFNVLLTPATVTAGQLTEGTTPTGRDKISLRIAMKLPKGAKFEAMTNLLFQTQSTAFPYASLYAGASQAVPKELTGASAFKLGKPSIKDGRNKKVALSTSGATFRLAQESAVSVLCKSGYGGTLVTGGNATASGCAICAAGKYGNQLDQQTACQSCKAVGGYSDVAGSSSCKNCTNGATPNTDGTGCGNAPPTTVNTFTMTANGSCSDATKTQIKNNEEAFLTSKPNVISATVTVNCQNSATTGRRRNLLQSQSATYNVTVVCIGTGCPDAYTGLTNSAAACCPTSASCTTPNIVPPSCTSVGGVTVSCSANQYVKNGACTPCGNNATSAGGTATTCTCKGTAVYNTTSDKCVCPTPTDAYDPATGCPTGPCGAGQYFDAVAKACFNCTKGCSTCTGPYSCSLCKPGDDSSLVKESNGYSTNAADVWLNPTPASTGRWLDATPGTCDTCIANCKECSDGTTCKTCFYGYFLRNSIYCAPCTDIGANCLECSSSSCTKCRPGFWLNNGVCTPCDDTTTGGSTACANCGSNGKTCTSCLAGYGFLATAGVCATCGAAGFTGSANCGWGTCTGTDTTCTSCTPVNLKAAAQNFFLSGSSTCDACTNFGISGSTAANGFCAKCSKNKNLCEICADGSYLDSAQQNCIKCSDTNCAQCSKASTCDVCKDGYYRDSNGACVACTSGFNCATCSEANKCTSCAAGASPIYYLDPNTKTCGICTIQNAVACASATVATKCNTGYFLNNGACVACRTTCATCVNSGGSAGTCAQCATGFPATDPADSASCITDNLAIGPAAVDISEGTGAPVTITITRKATANLPITTTTSFTVALSAGAITDYTFASGSATVTAVTATTLDLIVPATGTSTFTVAAITGTATVGNTVTITPVAGTGYTVTATAAVLTVVA